MHIHTREELEAYLTQQNVSPFRILVDLMMTTTDDKIRVQAAGLLADRLLPRLKAVEISGDPDKPLTLTDACARQARIAALLARRNGSSEE